MPVSHANWTPLKNYVSSSMLLLAVACGCSGGQDSARVTEPAAPASASAAADSNQPATEAAEEDIPSPNVVTTVPSSTVVRPGELADPASEGVPETVSPDFAAPVATEAVIDPAESTSTVAPKETDSSDSPTSGSLDDLLAELPVPPLWLAEVQTEWDTAKPWKDGRIEIRRLLSLGDSDTHRQAMKLTWLYLQKDDIGDGHEYPMYTFLGGEPVWSVYAHRWYLEQPHEHTPIHAYLTLAGLYSEFGEFEKAKQQLDIAAGGLPEPPWRIMRQADLARAYGDLYAAWGKSDEAKQHYLEAITLYPTGKPPYGRHLLPRRAAKVQAKLDLLAFRSLASTQLRDGRYEDRALGYVGDIHVTTLIQGGKIADIELKHEEKIDQNACTLIPQRIIEAQSLEVDGISGATVTKDAIIAGVYGCLKKAGLQ